MSIRGFTLCKIFCLSDRNDEIGDQSVTYKFHLGWEHFLSSFHSIIIAKIDTSGSRGRGDNWRKSIYRQIGAREVDEILAVVRYTNYHVLSSIDINYCNYLLH